MGEIEDFLGCMIKGDLTKNILNIYQLHQSTKITQGYNKYLKSLINFIAPATLHNGIV